MISAEADGTTASVPLALLALVLPLVWVFISGVCQLLTDCQDRLSKTARGDSKVPCGPCLRPVLRVVMCGEGELLNVAEPKHGASWIPIKGLPGEWWSEDKQDIAFFWCLEITGIIPIFSWVPSSGHVPTGFDIWYKWDDSIASVYPDSPASSYLSRSTHLTELLCCLSLTCQGSAGTSAQGLLDLLGVRVGFRDSPCIPWGLGRKVLPLQW